MEVNRKQKEQPCTNIFLCSHLLIVLHTNEQMFKGLAQKFWGGSDVLLWLVSSATKLARENVALDQNVLVC